MGVLSRGIAAVVSVSRVVLNGKPIPIPEGAICLRIEGSQHTQLHWDTEPMDAYYRGRMDGIELAIAALCQHTTPLWKIIADLRALKPSDRRERCRTNST